MDSLYLLLPMSVLLVLALIGVFAWALNAGQFDDLEREGLRVLEPDHPAGDTDTATVATDARGAAIGETNDHAPHEPLDPGQG